MGDFMHHVLNLELTEEFAIPEKEINTRLHRIALEYKRLVNLLPISPRGRRQIVNPLRNASGFLNKQGRKDYPAFSPQQRLQLIEQYAEENAAIACEYLGRKDGKLFYDPLPDPDEDWQPYDELLEEDARIINEYLIVNHLQTMEIIAGGILRAQGAPQIEVKKAALRLLPGIDPEIFSKVLEVGLNSAQEGNLGSQTDIDGIYDSRTWKTGWVINRIYNKTPALIRKPFLACAKWFYRRLK
jgi:hypothetical protein